MNALERMQANAAARAAEKASSPPPAVVAPVPTPVAAPAAPATAPTSAGAPSKALAAMQARAKQPRDLTSFFLQDESAFVHNHTPGPELERLLQITEQDLSPDQKRAYDAVMGWIEHGKTLSSQEHANILTLGGFAGTGKTALVALIAKSCTKRVGFAAYTGKASGVLRKKLKEIGVTPEFCGTLHSLCYQPVEDEDTGEVNWAKKAYLGYTNEDGNRVGFGLIIIDEASMVPDYMLDDLLSYGVRILGVGDHGQLPPVGGAGKLMLNPDLRLEKIHRQAESNPIIRLSACIRETGKLLRSSEDGDKIRFVDKRRMNQEIHDLYQGCFEDPLLDRVMLTYANADRVKFNQLAREAYFGPNVPAGPRDGELVICLRNTDVAFERGVGRVYNGLRGFVRGKPKTHEQFDHKLLTVFDFPEFGLGRAGIEICKFQFGYPNTFSQFGELTQFGFTPKMWWEVGGLFDYGYALTGHKVQGSQFSDVLVHLDKPGMVGAEAFKRWTYTCVTRATERLTVLV